MASFETLKISAIDHIEFAVKDLDKSCDWYYRMGFEKVATRELRERKLKSHLFQQNEIAILLSHSELSGDFIHTFLQNHGEGVANIAFRCEDAVSALETAVNRGATATELPKLSQRDFGSVQQTAIETPCSVRHTFLNRNGNLFLEGFETATKPHVRSRGTEKVDHVTLSVPRGDTSRWESFYQSIFGLEKLSLNSTLMGQTAMAVSLLKSQNEIFKLALVAPAETHSPIQDFLDIHHGAGVQHIALRCEDLPRFAKLLKKSGIVFREVLPSYKISLGGREESPSSADVTDLFGLNLLKAETPHGIRLHGFTENILGPFFYECFDPRGDNAFGEENVLAFAEAIRSVSQRALA